MPLDTEGATEINSAAPASEEAVQANPLEVSGESGDAAGSADTAVLGVDRTADTGAVAVAITAPAVASVATEASAAPARKPAPERKSPRRAISLPLSTLLWSAAVAALAIVAVVLGGLYFAARGDVSDRDAADATRLRAEQVATDYAVGAATISPGDMAGWVRNLTSGTTPVLANKFQATAPALEELLGQLKWSSRATPVAAKVTGEDNGVYTVSVFLTVNSTTAQTPQGAQTTVTYTVTVDKNSDWKITDVGGTLADLPMR